MLSVSLSFLYFFNHVMRGLKQTGRQVFGSPFERSYNRQLARGMLTAIGQESFMLTVNFDDVNFAGISMGWNKDGSIAFPSKVCQSGRICSVYDVGNVSGSIWI